VDPELVESAHGAGLAVYVFTVDDAEEMRRLLDLGVDGLFTNHPGRMRAILASREGGSRAGRRSLA
jgi:glycerophosphoryl diester phosphodiesterase